MSPLTAARSGVRAPHALLALLALPPGPGPQDAPLPEPERVVEHRLDNGWRFLLLRREGAPVVSFETYVRVGSVDEEPGESGLAHLFEHLAFKGSDRVGTRDWSRELAALQYLDARQTEWLQARDGGEPEEEGRARDAFFAARGEAEAFVVEEAFGRYFEQAGGAETLNASSSADGTRFYVSLPSNQVELWCWLEAERFQRPVLRELFRELDAVLEEHRTYVEADPLGTLLAALSRTAFPEHPYGRPVLGDPAEVARTTRGRARAFFEKHYTPERMVTAIVGDVYPDNVLPLLERYFGSIPSRAALRPEIPPPPPQDEGRRVEVRFPAQPLLAVGWRVPPLGHADHLAVDMAVRLLGSGRSSRLETRLLHEEALASEIGLWNGWPGDRFPCLAVFYAAPARGHATAEIEAVLAEEIERLASEGPDAEELAGARRRAQVQAWSEIELNAGLARRLAEAAAKTGSYRDAFERPSRLATVGAEDVQRVLRTYFTAENRTVATLVGEEAR